MTATETRSAYDIAAEHADDVDAQARFPVEAIGALREAGLLGALIPVADGGLGMTLTEVAAVTRKLGRMCSSTGMIFAMHHIQVACLVRHGRNQGLRDFTRLVAAEGLLLASATTEINIGGNTRTSGCAVTAANGRAKLTKQAPVISYGAYADAVLATARRDEESPPADQVLLVCEKDETVLDLKSGWDTLGFRGTCSNGFLLTADTTIDRVLDDPFAEISSHTMLPVSHLLWSSLWLGMAEGAEAKARTFVQAAARKAIGTVPPGALRLVELHNVLQSFRASVEQLLEKYETVQHDTELTSLSTFAFALNSLKIASSLTVVDIVTRALAICGISAYRNDSPYTLGRVLRDAHGAALMVSNDRIAGNNAELLLLLRD